MLVDTKTEPVVIKPNKLSGGRRITLDVTTENFDYAWEFAVNACKEQKRNIEILIQDKIEGVESRFLVIDEGFYSAILRIPAYVCGNGLETIDQLIDKKMKSEIKTLI